MAVPNEGYSVVTQISRIQRLLDDGSSTIPNAAVRSDTHLWKCSFMVLDDARKFFRVLEKSGLNGSDGPDSDVVLATEFDRSVEPSCEWLKSAVWEEAVIVWMAGPRPETVSARNSREPKVGSGLVFHDPAAMQFIEFLRLEDGIEVLLNERRGRSPNRFATSLSL
jgi:hypothetical protein